MNEKKTATTTTHLLYIFYYFFGIGGISDVYSLPGRKVCPPNTSLLRISITIDRQPEILYWQLENNNTAKTLFAQGPYPSSYAFGTIVEETCIETDSCLVSFIT